MKLGEDEGAARNHEENGRGYERIPGDVSHRVQGDIPGLVIKTASWVTFSQNGY
jgi:hypothetical protein